MQPVVKLLTTSISTISRAFYRCVRYTQHGTDDEFALDYYNALRHEVKTAIHMLRFGFLK